MKKMCVLVANEPRCYREAISHAIARLRPGVDVHEVEQEVLEAEVERCAPDLVLCSRLTSVIEDVALAWIELYPEGETRATVSMNGLRVTVIDDLGLNNVLWIVDQTEILHHSRTSGTR